MTPLQSLILRRWRPQWICPSRAAMRLAASRRRIATTTTTSPSTTTTTFPSTTTTTSSSSTSKPYYVTTPIFYVNADPHIGHLYTMVLSDVLKRWQLLKGRHAILCTGTDEHGMKIQQAATKAGLDPKPFCDKGAETFKNLAARVQLSNDHFVRTTDPEHREAVEYAWHVLNERGYIYASKHEGWYSVSDETFYPESQVHLVLDPPTGRKIMASKETGKEVEWTSEQNYHFRLSAFRDRLLSFYENNPNWITPKAKYDDVKAAVTFGLENLSISRPTKRLNWGIRVPTDDEQTIYVWLDALINYVTKAGYPWPPGKDDQGGWPADVQVIGKDIMRFHCIYWPAFLMALDLPLPKNILVHAHWTLGRQKMAKSTGNVVNPFFALDRFGVDTMRYYLVHDGGIDNDSDYDNRFIIERYKKILQGGLGNLSGRVMRAKGWNVPRAVKYFANKTKNDPTLPSYADAAVQSNIEYLMDFPAAVDGNMKRLRPQQALKRITETISLANAFITARSPWTIAARLKNHDGLSLELAALQKEMDLTVFICAEYLRLIGILLQPFMPDKAKMLLDMMGVSEDRRSFDHAVFGEDATYGVPFIPLGRAFEGALFPPLASEV